MPDPNDAQQELIDAHDGIYLVDAGAGTGKTFTVTRRYASILDTHDLDPSQLLLLTYTTAAADEMTDRIVDHCDRDFSELYDAPIGTFHSRCHELLRRYGIEAPRYLGLDEDITHSTSVLEDSGIEGMLFEEFYDRFVDEHPEHTELIQIVHDPSTVLGLIRELAAKGVVPTTDGWYRNGRDALFGDRESFEAMAERANEPNRGATGPTQSDLRHRLGNYGRNHIHQPTAPEKSELRGGRGTNQVERQWVMQAFDEDRTSLVAFIHDVYVEYLHYALGRNYLTFGMLQLFAFVLLCEDHTLRDSLGYEYVMIDEFQDTSEIQFKLALLLLDEPNLCVVGDWKQSIYSFQYADVENITRFRERLGRFTADLNDDHLRVDLQGREPESIELTENYRSPQEIITFAETALTTPATNRDSLDDAAEIRDQIVSLDAAAKDHEPQIEAITASDEVAGVLTKVQQIVDNPDYAIDDETPDYGDIAVLSRNHAFGRELLDAAQDAGIPVGYDGDVGLFDSDETKLVLAWLRILEYDGQRGWAVVLEQAGQSYKAIETALDRGEYPQQLLTFKEELSSYTRVDSLARAVLERYGFVGETADAVVTTIRATHSVTDFTNGDVIRYLERGIEQGWTRSVDGADTEDAVTIQTIHSVKGLQHPIVILANMNRHAFPGSGGWGGRLRYQEPVGIRQTDVIDTIDERPHRFRNWCWDVLNAVIPRDYDEERRLLYVALTRAEDHLLLSAGETPNRFFEELPIEAETIEPNVTPVDIGDPEQTQLGFEVPEETGPIRLSPHDLMDDVFDDSIDGRGTAYGQAVHDYAEAYVEGAAGDPTNTDEQNVAALIDGLDGELQTEEPIFLPMTVDGQQVTLLGYVDLLNLDDNRVTLIDYKTDRSDHALPQYRRQLSVYFHVLEEVYDDREVEAMIYFTAFDRCESITPLSFHELTELVTTELSTRQ